MATREKIAGEQREGTGAKNRRKNPRAKANPLSAATFCWTIPTFYRGLKSDFLESDLTQPLKEHSSSYLTNKFEKEWETEVEKCRKNGKVPSFLWVVAKGFGPRYILYGIPLIISEILRILQPLLLRKLIQYFLSNYNIPKNEAFLYALGVALCSVLPIILVHPHLQSTMHLGMKLRVAASNLIYMKALRMNKIARGKTSTGQIINLLSNDVGKFDSVFLYLHMLWFGPVETLVVTYLVWREVGVASLFGIFTILLAFPLQGFISKHTTKFRLKTSYKTDERIGIMNEIICGIQVIKMYTWEMPFIKLVNKARQNEMKDVVKVSYLKGILFSFMLFHTRIAFFVTILAYVLLGNTVASEKIFVVIALINTLRQTMTIYFQQGLLYFTDAFVAARRITDFLIAGDNIENPKAITAREKEALMSNNDSDKPSGKYDQIIDNANSFGIQIDDASAKWDEKAAEDTLSGITFEVKPKQLSVVIGPVGSGKTSLVHAVLNELTLTSGSITVFGSISYCSQEPWLYPGTVRENILFGSPYDKERYRQIIKVCCLGKDLKLFPRGDKTIVSERGTTLSGGQRARINLARAVYKDSDVYLLDDPLSAVDAHVGQHLFKYCIQEYLKNKTVILVTHQIQFLEKVDQIVLLQHGSLRAKGTYQDLCSSGIDFTQLPGLKHEEKLPPSTGDRLTVDFDLTAQGPGSRHSSIHSVRSYISDLSKIDPTGQSESQATGSVDASVYRKYVISLGNCCNLLVVLLFFLLSQVIASAGDYWISLWINAEENYLSQSIPYYSLSRQDFVTIFACLGIGVVAVTLVRSTLFFRMCMRSSMHLHNAMFGSIVRATMDFFNTNSSGRILNRFSKDIGIIDELLPQTLMDVLQIALTLIGIITIVAIVNFWFLVPTAVCLIIFYFFRIVYVSTARGVKRVEGICRSPVYAHINSTLQGLTTIRAFCAEQQVLTKFHEAMDLHSSAWFLFITTSRAFGYWLDLVSSCYITAVTLSFLFFDLGVTGSDVGLAITQAVTMTGMLQWGMRQSAELENCMTSVERVCEYSELESEPDLESTTDKKPEPTWPAEGKIEFKNVFLRYNPADPWVLKNLSFTVQSREKVGIVGRTGAGKSSLIGALFRLTDVSGQIIIDGIDISTIGLHDLRSKLSIIPQEPTLFAGTMRKNLDPFGEFTDAVIWDALQQVELKEAISEMPQGLHSVISEGGVNLSIGQRQLVCLARALLRRNRVLVLDEATANVDPQTDALIQKTIREKFKECTVLTIAHRLNSVMNSDRILVMSAGSMVEFDQPQKLLQDPYGYFYGLVQQTGDGNAEVLQKLAEPARNK